MSLFPRKEACVPSWPSALTVPFTELSVVPRLCLPVLGWDSQTEGGRRERTELGDCNRMSSRIFSGQYLTHSRISANIC